MTRKIKLIDFDDYMQNRLGKEEYSRLKEEAHREAEIYRSLQHQFSEYVKQYMQEESKGFNDLVNQLGLSQTQVNKILKGSGNFTFATLAHVFASIGKVPHLSINH